MSDEYTSETLPSQPGRMVVVGGSASEAELTAIAVALDDHHNADSDDDTSRQSRWMRAARLEGCGHPPISSPTGFSH